MVAWDKSEALISDFQNDFESTKLSSELRSRGWGFE